MEHPAFCTAVLVILPRKVALVHGAECPGVLSVKLGHGSGEMAVLETLIHAELWLLAMSQYPRLYIKQGHTATR